jgi:threonine dehydrogenase-like Zn-dependent dehydrogenase
MKGLVLTAEWQPKDGYEVTPAEEQSRKARLGNMVWKNPTVAVGERPDPTVAGDHDVVVRNRVCGVCGSDVHLFTPTADGYLNLPYFARLPIAMGHEYAGEVVEVGAAVRRVKPGDLVAIEGQVNCGSCRACLRGHPANCAFIEDRGFTLDGGAATLSATHERHCWPLTEIAEPYGEAHALDVGALVEPAAVVYNGMIKLANGFVPGDTVAVFGCGPIGLAAVGMAGALGAGRILAIEPNASKRELASALGATATFDPTSSDPAQWLLEETKAIGVDMAVDASGAGRVVVPSILASLAVGGKIVFLGINSEPVEIDMVALTVRAASTFSPIAHLGGGFPAVIALHAAGRLDLTPMITARYDLEDGVAALERAARGQDAKVMIYPQGFS